MILRTVRHTVDIIRVRISQNIDCRSLCFSISALDNDIKHIGTCFHIDCHSLSGTCCLSVHSNCCVSVNFRNYSKTVCLVAYHHTVTTEFPGKWLVQTSSFNFQSAKVRIAFHYFCYRCLIIIVCCFKCPVRHFLTAFPSYSF